MAGIGFDLKRLFLKDSITSKLRGVYIASISTVGPIIIFAVMWIIVAILMNLNEVTYLNQSLISTSCVYVFIYSVIVASVINTILSRYISDCIFEEKKENILASMYGALTLAIIPSALIGIGVYSFLYFYRDADLIYLVGLYFLQIMMTSAYVLMSVISAVKEYLRVSISYLAGMIVGAALFLVCYLVFKVDMAYCIVYSIAMAFTVINAMLISAARTFFKKSSYLCFDFLKYYKEYPLLAISSVFYILGIYAHNIVYWIFSPESSTIINFYKVYMIYDMACFFALIINLSAVVIFVIKTETKIFYYYKTYCHNLVNGTLNQIERSRKNMSRLLSLELFSLYETQLIVTILLTLVGYIVLPILGFTGPIIDYFITLSIAYYCIFSMYATVVFMYYFQDNVGATITTALFLSITIICCLVCIRLGPEYYSAGVFAGALLSWIFGFIRLKHSLVNINKRVFCNVQYKAN